MFDLRDMSLLYTLTPSDAAYQDMFGTSVALRGNTLLVGSVQAVDLTGAPGAAYLFDASTGTELAKLTASDGIAYDAFGTTVAITDTLALVGAPGNQQSGAVYAYDLATGLELQKLQAGGFMAQYGKSLATDGQDLLVGAPGTSANSAYLYSLSNFSLLHHFEMWGRVEGTPWPFPLPSS
ncbi:MAG: FG-GAP repeat protein [Planctomycetota bacterium]